MAMNTSSGEACSIRLRGMKAKNTTMTTNTRTAAPRMRETMNTVVPVLCDLGPKRSPR